jgi:hypothetical protein
MIRAPKIASSVAVLLFALGARARAADTKAVVAEIEAHDKAFLAAYENGETKKMKAEIGKAVALGEKNGLGSDAVMADTYVLAAVFAVDGNDDEKAGVRDFVKALKIKPDVAIPKGMATSPVKAALKQARLEAGLAPKEGAAGTAAASAPEAKPSETAKAEAPAKPDKAAEKKAAAEAAEKARAEAQAKEDEEKAQKAEAQKEQEQKDKQARDDRDHQAKATDRDKQLADAKARIQQLEKDKADRDKQLADAKARVQQLEKDKADRDKQLADARARNQQLEKDKADRDKQLADARAQEGKEREALDKVEHDKQAAESAAHDAEAKRQQERAQRERLFAGPEMPGHLREALTCAVPDDAPLRTDLFVHCVARPNVKAKSIIFYYRAGSAHYFSVPMERTTKGWYAAIVPGVRVVGKVMQYYAEALDGREAVVANNGKENSPNILTLHPGGPRS